MAYIRPVRVDEVEAVNDFLSKNGLIMPAPGAAAARFWEGRWVRNPTLSQHDPSVVHGWVLEDAGRMVGFFGNLPMAGVFGAEPVRIACASAWAVEPAYRDWVEKLCDCYFHQPNIDLLLVTSAIKPSAKSYIGSWKPRAFCVPLSEKKGVVAGWLGCWVFWARCRWISRCV